MAASEHGDRTRPSEDHPTTATDRKFVAVPLGLGATVDAQVAGDEVHGGVQLRADVVGCAVPMGTADAATGLGTGGRMRQQFYRDDRPLSDYDEHRCWRDFVHLCSAAQWTAITREVPPPSPVDRDACVEHGLP